VISLCGGPDEKRLVLKPTFLVPPGRNPATSDVCRASSCASKQRGSCGGPFEFYTLISSESRKDPPLFPFTSPTGPAFAGVTLPSTQRFFLSQILICQNCGKPKSAFSWKTLKCTLSYLQGTPLRSKLGDAFRRGTSGRPWKIQPPLDPRFAWF